MIPILQNHDPFFSKPFLKIKSLNLVTTNVNHGNLSKPQKNWRFLFIYENHDFSSRRKLREIVSRCFPHIPQEMVSKIIPNKEELNVAKISTHNEENVTCYLLNKKPIFFEYKEDLYPTGKTFPWFFFWMLFSYKTGRTDKTKIH